MTDAPLIAVERAIDTLKRGHAVRLEGAGTAIFARPAEWAAEESAPMTGRLAISAERAAYLGMTPGNSPGNGPVWVALEGTPPDFCAALLHAATPPACLPDARPGGPPEEAAIRLMRLAGFLPAALIISAEPAPGDAACVSVEAVNAYRAAPPALHMLAPVRVPLADAPDARIAAFRAGGGETHLAVLTGNPENDAAPLVRLHSSCMTGDLLGSLRCDCGSQLHRALAEMRAAGGGVLLYVSQEGRGIGLMSKLRAYALQDAGLDTVDANHALGYGADERDFSLAAAMLARLGIRSIRLLTNNPAKVEALEREGISVSERVPIRVEPGEHNHAYLKTKAARLGHLF